MGKKHAKVRRGDHYAPRKFPKGFLWGTATSAFQVEGMNRHADWWEWEQKSGRIADGTTSGRGVDHYNRYAEDFDIAEKHLHNNAHRLSIEWSRVEPHEGEWNEEEFHHYRKVLRDLKARGMKVMLTLHHFTNPQWLVEKGGWERRHAVKYFDRYVSKVCDELGGEVDLWCTINEPMVYVLQGYVSCEWPPAKRSYFKAFRVLMNMCRAHRRAYKTIHAWGKKRDRKVHVGIANNVSSLHVYRKHSLMDNFMSAVIDWFSNHFFYTITRPKRHDYLGLNYYFHFRIKTWKDFLRQTSIMKSKETIRFESSDIGWELFPHGIFDVCVDLSSYKKPIYVTENGLATSNDDKRIRVIVGYLLQLYYAIEAGADVRGYFHWSLLDNYEWAKGYKPTFGLVDVNRRTMERQPRASAEVYGLIAKDNEIKHDFLRFLGHGTHDILNEWKREHQLK